MSSAPTARLQSGLRPIGMSDAVGYGAIDCSHEAADAGIVLKHDRLFLLLDQHGNIHPPGQCGLGLFCDDTRILSHYRLHFSGGPPAVLSGQVPVIYSAQVDLAITDRSFGGDSWDPKNAVHIRREFLLSDRLIERVSLTNHLSRPIDLEIRLDLACDFADIFEVRGWRRRERGQFFSPQIEDRAIVFRYRGRDGQMLRSAVRFAHSPERLSTTGAEWFMHLAPGVKRVLECEVVADIGWPGCAPRAEVELDAQRASLEDTYSSWRSSCTKWKTDDAEFNATLSTAVDDLLALHIHVDGEGIVSAGIPWYSAPFGRDSIITSLQTLSVNPGIAVETLEYLARHQGEKVDPFTEEQPGRILHELRRGELARAGEIPHTPYYGTVDATPLWLVLFYETWRWTGDELLVRRLLPHAERALRWIDEYGDVDGDSLVEYHRTSERGLVNQGWKDSGDGVPFPDGSLPRPPIALVEVQGYVFDAKMRMAVLYDSLGEPERAAALRAQADRIREEVIRRFWNEQLGTFALALDGEKRPIPTATSNAAHLLWSRVAQPQQAARLVAQLLGPDMFSGWGIRTVSARHPVHNPMSYHNGSIWPHDNALAIMGLCFYGYGRTALPVVESLYEAAQQIRFHRLPELFCGMTRGTGQRPVLYPVSCSPHAWASGAFFLMLQALTGLLPDAPSKVLHIREPLLPRFLRRLTLTNLRIGGTRVSLQFRRHGERILANLLALDGELQVRIELT